MLFSVLITDKGDTRFFFIVEERIGDVRFVIVRNGIRDERLVLIDVD
jgi:hypothetical protein